MAGGRSLLFLLLLAVLSTTVWRSDSTKLADQQQACPGPSWQSDLASKAPYVPGKFGLEDKTCSVSKIFYVGRHCSRYPTGDSANNAIAELVKSLPFDARIEEWANATAMECENHYGDCSRCGLKEQHGLGYRFGQRLPKRSLLVNWAATPVQRTQDSATHWRLGLEAAAAATGAQVQFDPPEGPTIAECSTDVLGYSKLRFFSACSKYNKYKKTGSKAAEQAWVRSNASLPVLGATILARMGVPQSSIQNTTSDQRRQVALTAYGLCQQDVDMGLFKLNRWCQLLRAEEAALVSTGDVIGQCWKHGPCAPEVAFLDSCPLLRSMWLFVKGVSEPDAESQVIVDANFGHAETLTPLLTLLGLETKDSFVPTSMSANLQVFVESCGSEAFVTGFVNEEPVDWPGCGRRCALKEWADLMAEKLAAVPGQCDATGFTAWCGGLKCPEGEVYSTSLMV